MDSGLQSTEQAIRAVISALQKLLQQVPQKQVRTGPSCDKLYLLEGSLYRYEKLTRRNRDLDLKVMLILHVAVLIRNLESNKDMTEIANKSFDTNTGMFSNSFQLQPLEELQELKSEGRQF